ncbi:MAG: hypothetical protein R2831_12225 [Chitinophagaceae bacterium]
MKYASPFIINAILIFLIILTAYTFYLFFSDYTQFTIYHFSPFLNLVYVVLWLGIVLRKKWSFLLFVSFCMFETIIHLFFYNTNYGEVFGKILFPLNWLFAILVLILYKVHFTEKESK